MSESLIRFSEEKLTEAFKYIQDLGYLYVGSDLKEEDEYVIIFKNDLLNKSINFTISDSEDVHRFFITASIVKNPYLTVDDFVSFNVYLRKHNIQFDSVLDDDQIDERAIKKYIDAYAALFCRHGMPLITSDKQFPGYYPEWT